MLNTFRIHKMFTILVVVLLSFCFGCFGVYGKSILPFTYKANEVIDIDTLQLSQQSCPLEKMENNQDLDILDSYSYNCKDELLSAKATEFP